MTSAIILDIETRPDRSIDTPEFWAKKDIQAPSNWKDPIKIESFKHDAIEKERSRMALSATTGIIACIGVQTWADDHPTVFTVEEENREAEKNMLFDHFAPWWLENFDELETKVVTYNGRLFDMGFMAGRLMIHGVIIDFPKARDYRRHVDIYDDVLGKVGKQSEWEYAMGGEYKQHDGAATLKLSLIDLAQHCGEDVAALTSMAHRTQGIWGSR